MLELKKAGDIMIPIGEYPTLSSSCSIRQAIIEIGSRELDVGGKKSLPRVALVMNGGDRLLGTIRRRDLIRGLEPDFLISKPLKHRKMLFSGRADDDLTELSYDKMVESVRERAERPISEVMLPILRTVAHGDNLIKIAYEMVEFNTGLLPVLKNGKAVGVVRSVELFDEISKLIE